ncbi:galactose-1-phosphate uridylyltransferase [Desulfogranum mediterraneum]|uniref:galactose-1-phosphate uridylyltransferase n=1 Tax=Desulfogranum mediterraneum TaxID=160661 RepID=UPI0003FEB3E7|nr:galactose-1-phosphate uridylyltransferase [Desulfogranum mediterraneum]
MPELRKDPILGRWIIIAQERGKRPTDFLVEETKVKGGFCPLCPGHERTTPDEVLVYGRDQGQANTPGWELRVVPNKYPALVIEGELDKQGEGLYDRMNGIGAHEVIIESPSHHKSFTYLEPEEMILTFRAFRDRIRDLAKDQRFSYVMVFKNFGKAAGASLEHSHSQLVALPILPRMVSSELDGSLSYYRYKDRCVFCDIIRQELQQDIRLVCENSAFVTLAPYAPRSPFEMWIMPRRHSSNYADQDEGSLELLTDIFSQSLRRLDACIPNAPFNFVLHTQPLRSGPLEHYHWHFEIVPKLTSIAGFEWGTGFYINPMPPEETCTYLKEVSL